MTISKKIPVHDLIPQKEPFVFVDHVFDFKGRMWKSTFKVPEGHVFVEEGELLKAGYVEVLAQSLAAGITFFNEDDIPKVGFIGEVKGFCVYGTARVNDSLDVSVEVKNEVFNVLVVGGVISVNGKTLAEGTLKLVLQDQ
jgi:3-hydroxymyristoyl/3-hydroxydecanoyl-(acyl carrier protein) dehydratase